MDSHDLNRERKIEEEVGEHVNEIIIPKKARGAEPIPKPDFYCRKGIVDTPSRGLKKCFQTTVCYFDGWSKEGRTIQFQSMFLNKLKIVIFGTFLTNQRNEIFENGKNTIMLCLEFGQSQMKHLT